MVPAKVIHNAIKKHAGLSDWDDEAIEQLVVAILKALKRNKYIIEKDRTVGVSFKD